MSYQAVRYVLQHSPIYGKSRIVLISIAYHNDKDGLSFTSGDLLARECRMRKTEVRDCLEVLARAGEIVTLRKAAPRSSAGYLMLRFLETPDVGAPTVKILREPSESTPRDLTVPGMKTRVYSVPTIYSGNFEGLPLNSVGPARGSDCIQSERSREPKSAQWEPQGVPTAANRVPTEYSRNQSSCSYPQSVPAPPDGGSGNARAKTPPIPSAAALSSSASADGLTSSTPASRSALRPLDEDVHPSRSPAALHSMREILTHAARAAKGEEPFDFVGAEYVPEGGGK